MSAADARERLEAAIHAQLARARRFGPDPTGARIILAAADKYATSLAAEGSVAGRERLEQATAERTGEASVTWQQGGADIMWSGLGALVIAMAACAIGYWRRDRRERNGSRHD